MLRHSCISLAFALTLPTLALGSTLSFSASPASCANGYCTQAGLQHADINGDGLEDVIVTYPNGTGVTPNGIFGIGFNQGNGNYAKPVLYTIPNYSGGSDVIASIATGDFNHDGRIDLAVFGSGSGNLYIYSNNGKGALTLTATEAYLASPYPNSGLSVVVADFNHDGMPDLAFITGFQLHIWLGNGKGGFTPGLSQSVQGYSLALGDFDGDGLADLLIYNDNASNFTKAYVYYGDGIGHFPESTALTTSGSAIFSTGDVNSDGKTDVIVNDLTLSKNRVFVYYGDASRTFASRTNVLIGKCLAQVPVQVADLDGNGYNDLIVPEVSCTNPDTGPVYLGVLTRNPNASYNPDQTIYAVPDPTSSYNELLFGPQILNADHNPKPDLLLYQCLGQYCSNGYSSITLLNTTAGSFSKCNAPMAAEGINVCSPTTTSAVDSPVNFTIGAAGPTLMRDVEVWVDGRKLAEQIDGFSSYTYLDKSVSLTPGKHDVDVYADGWDETWIRKSFTVSVQ